MISRISVIPIKGDKSRNHYAFSSYLLEHNLGRKELLQVASMLTNSVLEQFFINSVPAIKNDTYAIEISFKPGVTDNVAHTVKETIRDSLGKQAENAEVYSSKIFVTKLKKLSDAEEFASSLY